MASWSIPWGETLKVSVTAINNGETIDITGSCSFSSSDDGILTAQNGLLYGKNTGTATLTVEAGGQTVSQQVEVLGASPTGIWFYDEKIQLPLVLYNAHGLRYSMILGADYDNGKTYDATRKAVWAVADPGVATVEGGVITALRPGKTKINARYGQFRAETTLEVFNNAPSRLKIDVGGGAAAAGGEPLALLAQLGFDGRGEYMANEYIEVHNRNPGIVKVSYVDGELLIFGLKEGEAEIIVSAFGLSETAVVKITD